MNRHSLYVHLGLGSREIKKKKGKNVEIPVEGSDRVQWPGRAHGLVHGVPGAVHGPQGEGVESRVPAGGPAAHRRASTADYRHVRQWRRRRHRRRCHTSPGHPGADPRARSHARDRADVPRGRRALAGRDPRGGAPNELSWYKGETFLRFLMCKAFC